jgi:hypothetical protein
VRAAQARSPAGVGAADPHDGAREQHLVAERQYGEPGRQLYRRVLHGGPRESRRGPCERRAGARQSGI